MESNGGCNEVVMEVAMEVVIIEGDENKILFIIHITHYYIIIFFISCTIITASQIMLLRILLPKL